MELTNLILMVYYQLLLKSSTYDQPGGKFCFSILKQITSTKLSVDLHKFITFMIHISILMIYLSIATEISFFYFSSFKLSTIVLSIATE
jgi:hypothetical protein